MQAAGTYFVVFTLFRRRVQKAREPSQRHAESATVR